MYTEKLMTQILDQGNLKQAIKQVKRNKGAAGVDGMETDELASSWVLHTTITNNRLERFGLLSLAKQYQKVHVM